MKKIFLLVFTICFTFSTTILAKSMRCKKQAEAIGILESQKKGNLSPAQLSVGNPTEQDGDSIIVYKRVAFVNCVDRYA